MFTWRMAGLFVLFITLCGCRTSTEPLVPPEKVVTADELAVYRDLATATFSGTPDLHLVICDSTSSIATDWLNEEKLRQLQGFDPEALANFKQMVPEIRKILSIPGLPFSHEFRSSGINWGSPEVEFGKMCYVTFSRVGFNPGKVRALVYMSQIWGPLAGSGDLYLLEKRGGKWVITDRLGVWIS